VQMLLAKGADPICRNGGDWSPMQEVIASGNKEIATLLFVSCTRKWHADFLSRLAEISAALAQLPDCFLTLHWELRTWVPFLSRFCPSDTYQVWKKGCNVKADATLVGFEHLQWQRGKLSYIFCGDSAVGPKAGDTVIVDHDKKQVDFAFSILQDNDAEALEDDMEDIMKQDLTSAKVPVEHIKFSPCKTWLGYERFDQVGTFKAQLYDVHGMEYTTVERKSSLIKEKKPKGYQKTVSQIVLTDIDSKPKRPEETPSVTAADYFDAKQKDLQRTKDKERWKAAGLTYPSEKFTEKKKAFHGTAWLARDFPHPLTELLPLLESLVSDDEQRKKMRGFLQEQLPPGTFPVKIDIPVFPTVTASVEIRAYEEKAVDASLFAIPKDYLVITSALRTQARKEGRKAARQTNKLDDAALEERGAGSRHNSEAWEE